MFLLQNIINNKLNKIIQEEKTRNRAALKCLLTLGYPMDKIRKSLLELNNLRLQDLKEKGVSNPSMYATLKGSRVNGKISTKAKKAIAAPLHLEASELWPE